MFIYIFLFLLPQFSAFGSGQSYDLLLEKFNQAEDLIDYRDLEDRRCISIRKSRPNVVDPALLKVYPGELVRPRIEAHTIPATPERLDYRHGPLLPPTIIPGLPETVVPFQSEIFIGKVYLEINGSFGGRKNRAYTSEALDNKITLRSTEIGKSFDLTSWYDYNFETIIKRSGNYLFFTKKNVYERSEDFIFVGYCWD